MSFNSIDVSAFESGAQTDVGPFHLIVKSLDQVERRARLIELKRRGRIGRIEERPVAVGLWACVAHLNGRRIDRLTAQVTEFREPRGLAQIAPDRFLLSDVSSVLLVDTEARNPSPLYTPILRISAFNFIRRCERPLSRCLLWIRLLD